MNNISHEKIWGWLRKRNYKRETESLLIVTQNTAVKTTISKQTYIRRKKNNRCKLCGDRDETVNHIIIECFKLAQKKRIKLDSTGWAKWSTWNFARDLNLTMEQMVYAQLRVKLKVN